MTQDIKLVCRDCKKEFVFSAGEQKFFEQRGFNPPSRCPECRKKKKQKHSPDNQEEKESNSNEMHTIVCKKCSKSTQVPFKPRNPQDVLCAECFEKMHPGE